MNGKGFVCCLFLLMVTFGVGCEEQSASSTITVKTLTELNAKELDIMSGLICAVCSEVVDGQTMYCGVKVFEAMPLLGIEVGEKFDEPIALPHCMSSSDRFATSAGKAKLKEKLERISAIMDPERGDFRELHIDEWYLHDPVSKKSTYKILGSMIVVIPTKISIGVR